MWNFKVSFVPARMLERDLHSFTSTGRANPGPEKTSQLLVQLTSPDLGSPKSPDNHAFAKKNKNNKLAFTMKNNDLGSIRGDVSVWCTYVVFCQKATFI